MQILIRCSEEFEDRPVDPLTEPELLAIREAYTTDEGNYGPFNEFSESMYVMQVLDRLEDLGYEV